MAILNFPQNPAQGDQYTGDNGTTYIFDGVKWVGHSSGGSAGTNSLRNGNFTVQVNSSGNLVIPAGALIIDANGDPVGGNANTGNVTFTNSTLFTPRNVDSLSQGVIKLAPGSSVATDYLDYGQFIQVYPTSTFDQPHIHIAAGTGQFGTGDLMLGDDNQYVNINHNGTIGVSAYDVTRGYNSYWQFDQEGILSGPAMGGLVVSGYIESSQYSNLVLSASQTRRGTTLVQFLDADGTEKDTYTVDYNIYSNILELNWQNVIGKTLWWSNGHSVTITGVVVNNDPTTIVLTLSDLVTLQAGTDYTVDWTLDSPHAVIIQTKNGNWDFGQDNVLSMTGPIRQNGSTTTSTGQYVSSGAPTVVWSSSSRWISSVKMTILVEANEDIDGTGWHTQTCEAIVAARGSNGTGNPVISVYGITYTSTVPLMTFSVQRNVTTNLIEVVGTRTAATTDTPYVKIHSVEISSSD